MSPSTRYRALFAGLVLVAACFLVLDNGSAASEGAYADVREQSGLPPGERQPLAPPRDGITVVSEHHEGNLVALAPNGTLLYHDDAHDGYWDVDPDPPGSETVLYAASDKLGPEEAACEPARGEDYCIRQVVERANLTTGEVTRLHSRVDPRYHDSEWHDVDRVDESRVVVADMFRDTVFVVDTETGIVTWEWNLQSYRSVDSAGPYPADWSHLNDVEVLDDGRFVVSLRNHDQVVFLDPERGVDEDWTLGEDDAHDVLYEQHNPDYIAEADGGPAVVVADSENNRVVEYQRECAGPEGGRGERGETAECEWVRSWTWQDSRMQWPRDADRLPNGNTLVADSQANRVVEIDASGDVVWELSASLPYEVERLGTGDESADGPSARRAGLESRTERLAGARDGTLGASERAERLLRGLLPGKLANGVLNGTPRWFGLLDALVLLVGSAALLAWLGFELRRAPVGLRSPVVRRK